MFPVKPCPTMTMPPMAMLAPKINPLTDPRCAGKPNAENSQQDATDNVDNPPSGIRADRAGTPTSSPRCRVVVLIIVGIRSAAESRFLLRFVRRVRGRFHAVVSTIVIVLVRLRGRLGGGSILRLVLHHLKVGFGGRGSDDRVACGALHVLAGVLIGHAQHFPASAVQYDRHGGPPRGASEVGESNSMATS